MLERRDGAYGPHVFDFAIGVERDKISAVVFATWRRGYQYE
jgi:hypothetical protein